MSRGFAVDFHVHTACSFDSITPARVAIEAARKRGLSGIAVTDHETVAGALAAVEANPYRDFLVIPGIEVKTDVGDVIGLYVTQEIRSRDVAGVISEIHAQGGLAYMPHPIRTFGAAHLSTVRAERSDIDAWERYNGRYDAAEMQHAHDSLQAFDDDLMLCGSDAHFPWEVGLFRTILEDLPSTPQMLLALAETARLETLARGDIGRRAGITLGAMIKDLKRKRYAKVGTLAATLPWKLMRRALRG